MTEMLAALDIGTNSFHLVVARFEEGTAFEVVAREKEMVRLGSGSGDMKRLQPDAIDRGIAALRRFAAVAEVHDAEVFAVATSAVREAENAPEFLERARLEAGVEVDVISGLEEARLIHLGVIQALPLVERRLLLIDIGGGSTEVLVGEGGETVLATSLKVGALRLTRRFFADEVLDRDALEACRRCVRDAVAPYEKDVRSSGFEVAVASSGTAEAVVRLVDRRRDEPALPRTYNGFEVTRQEVRAVVEALAELPTVAERRDLPGVESSRADILLAGAVILEQLLAALGIERLVFSEYALREGALLDALQRRRGATLHHLHDLRRRSVLRLADVMDEDPGHSSNVADLALQLFDATRSWHQRDDDDRELLEAAALLCNIGLSVGHSGHHKHSYYLIRNAEHLTGFTDHEIEVIALVARYHRKSEPKQGHAEFAAQLPEDQERVRALAALLRVAIALDRRRGGEVACVTVGPASSTGDADGAPVADAVGATPTDGEDRPPVDAAASASAGAAAASSRPPGVGANGQGPERGDPADGVVLSVTARHGADLALELYSATQRKGLLEQVLGVPVRFEPVPAPATA